jgi:hypothetical protein
MADRGLLLLDVDGPLNPYAAGWPRRPRGYLPFLETADGGWIGGWQTRWRKGYRVWLHPGHGELLHALAAQTGLELVWATAWQHVANARIAPAIGLDPLPVIEFTADMVRDNNGRSHWRRGGGWKWPAIAAYAAGRPLAWFDDEHNAADYAAPRVAFERDRVDLPTLLCHVDPHHGLGPTHFAEIRSWAAGLS